MSTNSMKRLMIVVVIVMTTFISCKKNTLTANGDLENEVVKTSRIYNTQTPLVSASEWGSVQGLFQKNNLSLSNLQVYELQTSDGFHYVRCYQFFQGLELFTNDVVFVFDRDDNYSSLGGELITNISIDAVVRTTMYDASTMFFGKIVQDYAYHDSLDSFRYRGFNAELGIYDLNAGIGATQKHFVPVWKITAANGLRYPIGYIRADSLHLIYYFNGIIIN